MQLSVYKQFSENLRTFCGLRGTIADVCRDLEINRQQFNKYLSGAALPNPKTLTKLAEYFGVDQIEFFQSREAVRGHPTADSLQDVQGKLQGNAAIIKHVSRTMAEGLDVPLQDGCYHIYYPWLLDPALVVRSVLVVFRKDGFCYFRRFTRLQNTQSEKLRHYPRGCHEGLILRHDDNICLIGRNSIGFGELSLQTFAFESFLTENAITGLSLVITPWGEYCALRATMSYVGPISSFRMALKLAKIGPIDTVNIPFFIAQSVTAPLTSGIPQMRPFGLDDWLRVVGKKVAQKGKSKSTTK